MSSPTSPDPNAAPAEVLAPTVDAPVPPALAALSGHPEQIDRFRLLRFVGEGSFGRVYEAFDPSLKRPVALKVARSDLGLSAERVERFRREARAAARLAHPNIVSVFDSGQDGPHHYIASAFVTGRSLEQVLEELPVGQTLPQRQAVEIVRKLAEALAYAHREGVIHRDVKSANVMLRDDGEPLLMDFGMARRSDETEELTAEGKVLGTVQYMAPEQAEGKAEPASDQYSLGCLLFKLLTGRLPFRGDNLAHYLMQHHSQPAPSPRSLNSLISRDLETICQKCLSKEPARRYASCQALADDLRRWLAGEPTLARPVGPFERAWRWCRRNPALAGALAGLLLVLVIGTTISTLLAVQARRQQAEAVAARKTVEESNDRLRTSAARYLLAPLALEGKPGKPPLIEAEVEVLWELATSQDELRLRFVEVASSTPLYTRQFRDRTAFVLQAVVGLDSSRRARVLALLEAKLRAEESTEEQQRDLALILASAGIDDPELVSLTVRTLTQALSKTRDAHLLILLVEGLEALGARMESREAHEAVVALTGAQRQTTNTNAVQILGRGLSAMAMRLERLEVREVAATLTRELGQTRNSYLARRNLAEALAVVAGRLEPGEARQVYAEAAATLTQALREATHPVAVGNLAEGLTAVATRLDSREAQEAATALIRALGQPVNWMAARSLAEYLALVAGKLESDGSREVAVALTRILDQTTDATVQRSMGESLAAVAAKLESREVREAALVLTRALGKQTTDSGTSRSLARGLSAVAGKLESGDAREVAAALTPVLYQVTNPYVARNVTEALAAVVGRLEGGEARQVYTQAAVALVQAMSQTTNPVVLLSQAEGLAAVTGRLEAGEARKHCTQAAHLLSRAMRRATTPVVSASVAQGLVAVAGQMEAGEARKVCAEATAGLLQALSQAADPLSALLAVGGLTTLAPHLEAEEARKVYAQAAVALTGVLRRPKIPMFGPGAAKSLATVTARLDAGEARQVSAQVATTLTRALSQSTDPTTRRNLAEALTAVAGWLENGEAREATAALRQALSQPTDRYTESALAISLLAVAARLEPQEGREAAAHAAAALTDALAKTMPTAGGIHAMDLSASLAREPSATTRKRCVALASTMASCSDLAGALTARALLPDALAPLPDPLPPQDLVDLLKHPLCVGEARRVVLRQLSVHYQRSFADQWEFVRFATEQGLDLDLTSPPRRYQAGSAAALGGKQP
jgi:tRNA A-37 threonylcarbamoyl transferase component Bud32